MKSHCGFRAHDQGASDMFPYAIGTSQCLSVPEASEAARAPLEACRAQRAPAPPKPSEVGPPKMLSVNAERSGEMQLCSKSKATVAWCGLTPGKEFDQGAAE